MLLSCLFFLLGGCENFVTNERDITGTGDSPQILLNDAAPPEGSLPVAVGSDVTVTLIGSSTAISIHYTLDGSDPTTRSPEYSRPISLTGLEEDTTIRALEVTRDGEAAAPVSAEIHITDSLWYRIDDGDRVGDVVQVALSPPGDEVITPTRDVLLTRYRGLFPVSVDQRRSWVLGFRDRGIIGGTGDESEATTHLIAAWSTTEGGWNSQLWLRVKEAESSYALVSTRDPGGNTPARLVIANGETNTVLSFANLQIDSDSAMVADRVGVPIRVGFSGTSGRDMSISGTLFVRRGADTPFDLGSDRTPFDLTLNRSGLAWGMTGPEGTSVYRISGLDPNEETEVTIYLGLVRNINNDGTPTFETPAGLANAVTVSTPDGSTTVDPDLDDGAGTFTLTADRDGRILFSITSEAGASYTLHVPPAAEEPSR